MESVRKQQLEPDIPNTRAGSRNADWIPLSYLFDLPRNADMHSISSSFVSKANCGIINKGNSIFKMCQSRLSPMQIPY